MPLLAVVVFLLQTPIISTTPSADAAATLPANFIDSTFAAGLTNPTAMTFAPDGRLFIAEQAGNLRVVENGVLLPTPFVSLVVDSLGERGLLGIAFDPNFGVNHFVYVYYTATTPATHNRISRFTANGNVALAGSEVVLLELNNLSTASNHNGGAIHFGPDGKLYAAVGENANRANAQDLSNLLGKVLRINSDGSIPSDNPFSGAGVRSEIWALGLRNPFTFAFQPGTGRMFINDVGEVTWEEINDGLVGSNYGWPISEGLDPTHPELRQPLLTYGHGSGANLGCAIAGGAFYNPSVSMFPASYTGKYFYADLCGGWIRQFDPALGTSTTFAQGINFPVDVQLGADGALYYLARGAGSVGRIAYGVKAAITSPSPGSTLSGSSVTFTRDAGTNTTAWALQVGTSFASGDLFTLNSWPSMTTPVSNLPTNGSTVYVRIWSFVSGVWQVNDYTYTAAFIAGTKAAITSPTPGTTLAGATATFTRNAGLNVSAWGLQIGTSFASGDLMQIDSWTATNATPTNLPTNGSTVYVRLWSFLNGGWQVNDYTYTAATLSGTKAAITSPTPGSTLPGSTVTFTRNNGVNVTAWALQVGTSFGSGDLVTLNSWPSTTTTATNIPTNGATVFVRLWSFLNGAWQITDYSYTASGTGGNVKAAITSPTPGTTLAGASVTFTRNNGVGVSAWALQIGTSFASGNLLTINSWTALTAQATNLPTNGSTVYVRIWSFVNGAWAVTDYTYRAAG